MKKKILLSFCIPTYNRPIQFGRLIKQLAPQITDEIEIVIRDDSPNELTKEIVERELKDCDAPVRYFKGEKIGLDIANLFLLEKAEGKWMWWFSDDDELMPGAIEHTLNVFKKHPDIDFMWVNFAYGNDRKLAIHLPEERFFKDRNEVFELLGPNIGLLSTLIIKRKKGLPFLGLGRKHSTGFAFAALIPVFGSLSGDGRFYFLRGPYIFNNPTTIEEIKNITTKKGSIENPAFDVFGVNFYETVMLFRDSFSKKAVKKLLATNFAALWRGMLVGWIGGWDTPKGKRWRMFKLFWSYPECWIALPIMLMPLWVNRGLYRVYKIFFSHRKFVFGENLNKFFRKIS